MSKSDMVAMIYIAKLAIEHLLLQFSMLPNEICTALEAANIKGIRASEASCPIAHFICASLPRLADENIIVKVRSETVEVWSHHDGHWARAVVQQPPGVHQFTYDFDIGMYPQLDVFQGVKG